MDLVGPITPIGYLEEYYFFSFTNDCICYTKTYTGTKKSNWRQCLKNFYNLAKI